MKVTINAFVYQNTSFCGEITHSIHMWDDWSNPHTALVGPVEVSYEVPDDFDSRPPRIAALQKEKSEIQAEANKKVVDIEQKIAELLAITHEVKA